MNILGESYCETDSLQGEESGADGGDQEAEVHQAAHPNLSLSPRYQHLSAVKQTSTGLYSSCAALAYFLGTLN